MIFTAMVNRILLNAVQLADPRLETTPRTVSTIDSFQSTLQLNTAWTAPFDIGGSNLIITRDSLLNAQLNEVGGLILSGEGLPFDRMRNHDDTANVYDGFGRSIYYETVKNGDGDITEYYVYTHYNSVITRTRYNLNADNPNDPGGPFPGRDNFNPGSVNSVTYRIYMAVPFTYSVTAAYFVCVKQSETINPGIDTDDVIDLRKYIANITWSTSIERGYDTATVELNESASNLGKYYSGLIGCNLSIIDIYGNQCWEGLISSIYIDGGGGRIDAVGYKKTFDWFRFDKIYPRPADGWSTTVRGPTTTQILNDCMNMNPYMRKLGTYAISESVSAPLNWQIDGFVYADNGPINTVSWSNQQWAVQPVWTALDEIDFSDGSSKCSDAISLVEKFGYVYTQEQKDLDRDTLAVQCWKAGFMSIQRIRKDPSTLNPDYIISRFNLKHNNRGVEISADINDVISETYVIYSDSDGATNTSVSVYNKALAVEYGVRLKIESTDVGPSLAGEIAKASRSDKSNIVGIGNVTISGNVKGGRGTMNNIPCYMLKAGRVIEFEDNIGHGTLYRNRDGTPGIFYIGSTTYSTSTGELTLTPATTLSVIDMFMQRQSAIIN